MMVLRIFIALFLSTLVTLVAPAHAQNQTQTQMQPSFELRNNVSTLMRSLLTEQVSGVDRSLLISDLEQAIQSFLTDTINVEFDIREDGNEKVLTITTTSAPTEDSSDDNGDDNSDDNGNGNDEPPEEPEEPEQPTDLPSVPIG
jgi:hypothetical protein